MAPLIQTANLSSREKQVTRLILQSLQRMGYEYEESLIIGNSGLTTDKLPRI